jgi:hypothetical protein
LKLFIFDGFTYSMNLSIIVLFSGYIYTKLRYTIYTELIKWIYRTVYEIF